MYSCCWAYLEQTQKQKIRSPLLPDLPKQSAAAWELWLSSFQVCWTLAPWGDTSHSAATVGKHLPLARPHSRHGFANRSSGG